MADIKYTPVKCAYKECAFPNLICEHCPSNKSMHGVRALVIKDPRSNYQFCRNLMFLNPA